MFTAYSQACSTLAYALKAALLVPYDRKVSRQKACAIPKGEIASPHISVRDKEFMFIRKSPISYTHIKYTPFSKELRRGSRETYKYNIPIINRRASKFLKLASEFFTRNRLKFKA